MHCSLIVSATLRACRLVAGAFLLSACGGGGGNSTPPPVTPPGVKSFGDRALVGDSSASVATAKVFDANLQNPWGIAFAPGQPFWIADNNSNVTTLYSGTGTIQTQAVTGSTSVGIAIPASAFGVAANPTGEVYNGGGGFLISTPKGKESALFIYDGEGGTIAAWAADSGASALTAYDDGIANGADHAVYKGLALGTIAGASYLYATDLHNNKIDVFDTNFSKPASSQGKFLDPGLPSGYAPFGIAAVNGQLFVTFAMQDGAKHDEVAGLGMSYVDVFDFSGNFVSRFASAGVLNAPWGIAAVPAGFGSFNGDVLIGNFGDGTINGFAPNGTALAMSVGPLNTSTGASLAFPGLWSLVFGNGDADKPATTLFYTAGFANQTTGVFGAITVNTGTGY